MKQMWVARHAPTDAGGLLYGRLAARPRVDPQDASRELQRTLLAVPDRVWCSPSARCRDAAVLLAARLGVECHMDGRLAERDYGAWEGVPWSTLERNAESELWVRAGMVSAPPEGESLASLESRVKQFCKDLDDGAHALIVDEGVLRSLRVVVDGLSWREALQLEVPFLKWEEFDLSIRNSGRHRINPATFMRRSRTPAAFVAVDDSERRRR